MSPWVVQHPLMSSIHTIIRTLTNYSFYIFTHILLLSLIIIINYNIFIDDYDDTHELLSFIDDDFPSFFLLS